MQLQQNLFSIYRLFLKLPKYLFLAGLVLLSIIAISQLVHVLGDSSQLDLSECLMDYVLQKHSNLVNETVTNGSMVVENKTKQIEQYRLLDDKTFLNVEIGKVNKCQFVINYPYKYDVGRLPLVFVTKNEQLAYLKQKPEKYLKTHGITYDKIVIPDPQLSQPTFSYFYNPEMRLNEYLIESIRDSLVKLDSRFLFYALASNLTHAKLVMDELYLTFYYLQPGVKYQETINLNQFVKVKLLSMFLLKFIFAISMLILMYFLSIFVGLLIRYSLFLVYTAFLLVYDKCMSEGWGWVHQYLSILYTRFRVNKLTTLKFIIFYVLANVGMHGLLSFGCYCILKKLLYPVIPLPVEMYNDFFLKIIFFIELFLFLFCRSRTSLRFFPILSFTVCYIFMIIIAIKAYGNTMLLLNLCFSLQLLLFAGFILIQQAILDDNEKGMIGEYCPSINKPRMMFYAGYDISWEKSLPPIWTYFTSWFDYSYFSEGEKCLMEKDYQLLYGRMLGLQERQQIPEFDEEEHQQVNEGVRLRDQPSNQMNLIQNDV